MRKLRNLKWKILALLARWGILLPGKIMYIGGSDTLPPPLSREEEAALLARLDAGEETVRQILIERNLRLVVYIARKFESTGTGLEDLISIGAYKSGTNPRLDDAIARIDRVNAFLMQKIDESFSRDQSVEIMKEILR